MNIITIMLSDQFTLHYQPTRRLDVVYGGIVSHFGAFSC